MIVISPLHCRLSYIVYGLEKVLESSQVCHEEVHLLYDVACILYRHLQVYFVYCVLGRHDLLGYFQLAVPVFHSYGHKLTVRFASYVSIIAVE